MPRLNPFTPEQIRSLEANRYTHHVTPNKIAFTVEFKEFFASQAALPGMTTKKILRAAGYDPDLFSRSGLDSIRQSILREAASKDGFKIPRGLSSTERIKRTPQMEKLADRAVSGQLNVHPISKKLKIRPYGDSELVHEE